MARSDGYLKKGPDPRRYTGGRLPKHAHLVRTHLRPHRQDVAKRLLELTKAEDPRVALEAIRLFITLTDGDPHKMTPPQEEVPEPTDAGDEAAIAPPEPESATGGQVIQMPGGES